MATYIQDTLDLIDGAVATYAQSVFVDSAGPIADDDPSRQAWCRSPSSRSTS